MSSTPDNRRSTALAISIAIILTVVFASTRLFDNPSEPEVPKKAQASPTKSEKSYEPRRGGFTDAKNLATEIE